MTHQNIAMSHLENHGARSNLDHIKASNTSLMIILVIVLDDKIKDGHLLLICDYLNELFPLEKFSKKSNTKNEQK